MNFNEKVWKRCARIPYGKITTYKELARSLNTKAYRAVGRALKINPYAPKVPCHRVVNSDHTLGGYQGKNYAKKAQLLKREGIIIKNKKIKNFKERLFTFSSS